MASKDILALAGSTRENSFNKKLIKIAAEGARKAGALVTGIDLRDYPLPVFDEDLESRDGLPANALKLKKIFLAHGGLLIAAPEYNSSITPVLKNTLDWVSRASRGEAPLACFEGKTAALMSASPGALGGLRGLVHLRSILGNIKVLVLPDQIAIVKAHEAFHDDGTLKEPWLQAGVEKLGENLAKMMEKLTAGGL